MRRPERWALAVVALATAASATAEPALMPVRLPEDEYVESFTFVADLDDGTYLQAQLGVTNIGPGSANAFCRVLVARPGASPWTASDRFGSGRWSHRVDGDSERLDVGTCSATSGPGGTVAHVVLGSRDVEIRFPERAAPRDPPWGEVKVGDRVYRSWILQAFTQVTARLVGFRSDGTLAGGGYADHSRSNVRPKDLARSWIRFRALRGPSPLLVLGRQDPDGAWAPAWELRPGVAAEPVSRITVTRGEPRSAPVFTITLEGAASGRIATVSPVYRFASLNELGLLGRMVAPWVGNPVTYTQRATLSPPGERPVDGILEVSVSED